MVVDGRTLYIGTFNLDPRSANLNTEVGIIVDSRELAQEVEASIVNDMSEDNSWQAGVEGTDKKAGFLKPNITLHIKYLLDFNDSFIKHLIFFS